MASLALAGSQATIEAEVGPRLSWVRGTLTLTGEAASWPVDDPLLDLPLPADDRTASRTFPGRAEQGHVTWVETSPGVYEFHAWLPRRFGGIGATRHGLFALGGWYPQPRSPDSALPVMSWDVTVRGPADTVTALASSVGGDEVRWRGDAERVPLSVVPRGVVRRVGQGEVWMVARRRIPRRWYREVEQLAASAGDRARGVVVRAPLRRRLGRAGPGQALLSDRAFQVTPGFFRLHRVGVARGVMPAWVPHADPVVRDWVGASWAADYASELSGASAGKLARMTRWMPGIDAMLTSATIPYYGDILERPYRTEPLADDLVEMRAPHYPGPAVVRMVDAALGEGAHRGLAERWLQDLSVADLVSEDWNRAELPARWRGPVPDQDYVLSLRDGVATLVRESPEDAPPEWIRLRVDGEVREFLGEPGPFLLPLGAGIRSVSFDPSGLLWQRSRRAESWPLRVRMTAGASISSINLTTQRMVASLYGSVRRAGDTRHVFWGSLATSDSDLGRLRLGYTRRFGRPVDGLRRLHRFTVSASGARQHPWVVQDTGNRSSLQLASSWGWSNMVASYVPQRGSSVSVGGSVGYAPDLGDMWTGLGGRARTLLSWHPRWVFDVSVGASGAMGDGENRKKELGGIGGIRGLDPASTPRGAWRTMQQGELRWSPIRQANVPLGLAWARELQLGAGLEVGQIVDAGQVQWGVGALVGVFGIADVFGIEPRGAGLTLGIPIRDADGPVRFGSRWPMFYLRWGPAL